MAKDRITPCEYYVCAGTCKKVEMRIMPITARSVISISLELGNDILISRNRSWRRLGGVENNGIF